MTLLAILIAAAAADSLVLEERIDLYDPVSMAYLGAERTWFGVEGQRLRLEVTDSDGSLSLLFFVRHDELGREAEAIYFEGDSPDADREVFSYSGDGRVRTTTYYYEPDVASDRTESELDPEGREVRKRYFRADGSQYGREEVLRAPSGAKLGWDFEYVGRSAGASFRYDYGDGEPDPDWDRRVRSRDGTPERIEVRSVVHASGEPPRHETLIFAPGAVSTSASETSPSFSADGETMVFARYDDDWTRKTAFIGTLGESGWTVDPLDELGTVYNLSLSPEADAIVFSRRFGDRTELFRVRNTGTTWSEPVSLTDAYGLAGSYPQLTASGDLVYLDDGRAEGSGIYVARALRDGFAEPEPLYVPDRGVAFDAFLDSERKALLVTRCFDDVCESWGEHGVWEIDVETASARQVPGLPYVWGAQPVESLGLLVITDGEDIRAVPLRNVSDR